MGIRGSSDPRLLLRTECEDHNGVMTDLALSSPFFRALRQEVAPRAGDWGARGRKIVDGRGGRGDIHDKS